MPGLWEDGNHTKFPDLKLGKSAHLQRENMQDIEKHRSGQRDGLRINNIIWMR